MKGATLVSVCAFVSLTVISGLRADLTPYSQDFEGLIASSPTALSGDGWEVFGNVYDPLGGFIGGYGPFPAPNGGPAFSAIASGDAGPAQGSQYLNVYSDYNNAAHASGNYLEALVLQQQTVGAGDVGKTISLSFDYRANPSNGAGVDSTTLAFIKVLKQSDSSFDELGLVQFDTTSALEWQSQSITLVISPEWAGELLQFGFQSYSTNFNATGRFYDNIVFAVGTAAGTTVTVDPGETWLGYMNVFNINRPPQGPPTPGSFVFGSPWGFADLTASFDLDNCLTLGVNSIEDPNPFWYTPAGGPGALGNKWMDASSYVEKSDSPNFSGTNVTFSGTVKANTFTANHTARAFIRDFSPDYSTFQEVSVALTSDTFSISMDTVAGAGRHVQYGFNVQGENVWITDSAPFGTVVVGDSSTPTASVVARYVYHHDSVFAGVSVNNALDTDKQLAKAGTEPQTLDYVNLINSSRGINGVVFDIQDLAGAPTADDFEFRMSPTGAFDLGANPPNAWAIAPVPTSVTVEPGSPDRIVIVWPNNAIANRWLRITVKGNSNTGLADSEVYYVGHLLGETSGLSSGFYTVAFADITPIRNAVGQLVNASSIADIDKNGTVLFGDISAMRSSIGSQLTNIVIPPVGQ